MIYKKKSLVYFIPAPSYKSLGLVGGQSTTVGLTSSREGDGNGKIAQALVAGSLGSKS